ncbi:hypothetical protein Mpet_1470 [Methanolacinia petrolearia DSM 11571]|uniref:Uncharacterized protein n=1 Tax=Methanolacinia petrolearia (strain DSM 11571 / OCM 486 / SEBR 4847) TaxID=679926 RepID=E1RFJ9_METP4|nr:hypothetical protein [Methanolacinia petrolearia]ADN36229.1 hypothetical protein Mpet_1470 [Methanolacinia petrolearia DSM 11571]
MGQDISTDKLDIEETAAKFKRAMEQILEVNDDIVKHESDFEENTFKLLRYPLKKAIPELSDANRMFEKLVEVYNDMKEAGLR